MKNYSIDPTLISLEEFRKMIVSKEMLPARVMLREHMEERFKSLQEAGIEHLGHLLSLLSTKAKIRQFSEKSGLNVDYLVLLKREAGSYLSKPFPLSDFPGIPFEYAEILRSRGLKNTRNFFESTQSEELQSDLSKDTGIPEYRIKELHSLCDLSRITGVGGAFARILYEAEIRSVEAYAVMDATVSLKRCRQVIEKHGYAAGKLGEKDMQYGINYAKAVIACDQKSDNI